ncbi:MAG: CvpA family protein [Pseudomonadota bacterium]|nr:CvpA family protein [Pseudomonadota bacterium]MEC7685240.1 CvpA family protein [Pseudomonadota bacterium]MEC7893969.1 CvpA family protein [Pseudomonadota bacterium]MEC7997791.1 CvpA family protein [Pseudomonadota bacterium]MEC8331945.1 CvpA family protein [Pseudomonadota bacterium]
MTQVDNLILAVIAISSAFGVRRGFIKEIMSLLSWIAALLVSRVYSVSLASILENLIDNPSVRYVIAFSVLFVIIIMLGTLLNHLMSKLLVVTGLKTIDRLLGAVFGVARGTVIVLVFLFVLNVFVSESEWWQQSTLIPYGMVLIEESQFFIGDMDALSPT